VILHYGAWRPAARSGQRAGSYWLDRARSPAAADSLRQAGVALRAGDMREPDTYVPP